jgi:hypothetical protein
MSDNSKSDLKKINQLIKSTDFIEIEEKQVSYA